MNLLESFLSQSLVTALGWALLHFLWQGALVALLLAGVLRLLKECSTNVRYTASCAAMLTMLALPLVTMAVILRPASAKTAIELQPRFAAPAQQKALMAEREQSVASVRTITSTNFASSWPAWQRVNSRALLPWMILLWLSGVVFFSLRLIGGWIYTQRLKTREVRPMEPDWQQTLTRLCQQLRITRPVRLLESAMVQVPTAIGWLRPVILIPVGALTGLNPQQLEAIIAHELAHIRRHDYLINLLQAVIETLLFYHPAVWWVSRQIRNERELCCDDLAVAVCGDALTYARALVEMEQLRSASPRLAVAANGGMLMNRIQRLVGVQTRHNNRFAGVFASLIVLAVLVTVVLVAPTLFHPAEAINVQQNSEASSVATQQVKQIRTESLVKKSDSKTVVTAQQNDVVEDLISAIETEEVKQEQVANVIQTSNPEPMPNSQNPNPQPNANQISRPNPQELNSPDPAQRAAAACTMQKAGAVDAIPALIALLGDDAPIQQINCWSAGTWSPAKQKFKQASPGEQAAITLASFGEVAVDPLIAALNSANSSVRRNAAWAIGEIRGGQRTNRTAAVDPLIAALGDEDAWVRMAAAFSLGEIRPRRAVESLIAALGDSEGNVRQMAAWALGEMKTRLGVESLAAVLVNDHSEGVRQMAAWALGEIGHKDALDALKTALNDQNQQVRTTAKWALSEIND